MLRLHVALVALALAVASTTSASATQLVFRYDFGLLPLADNALDGSGINYGDRVASSGQGDYEYGLAGGLTPNVVVDYGTNPTGSAFHGFETGYGDLEHGVYGESATGDLISELTLTADAGFRVQLSSFDVAGFTQDRIANVTVFDSANAVLFAQADAPIDGTSGHTAFSFGTPLEASAIKIQVQVQTSISAVQGASPALLEETLGFDNIVFSQTAVPEPAALALAAPLALAAVMLARRRRQ